MSSPIQALLDEGARSGVFPSARAVVIRGGEVVFSGGVGAREDTVYDLASLTKVLCTTSVFLSLWGEGRVRPEDPLERFLPTAAAARAGATLADLLFHRAGLPAFVPFFASVMRGYPRLFDPDCPAMLRDQARRDVVHQALATAPVSPLRSAAVYSDVGFILLGEALAAASGRSLDALFSERIAAPLGLALRFRPLSSVPPALECAATGATRPREPAPGQEGLWAGLPARPSPPGEVDDDNAWVMDGVAGHAGLFGTAADLAAFGQVVLDELRGAGKIAPQALWERAVRPDASTPGSTRALGFDTPSTVDSSAGRFFGRRSPGAIGHLGFTGVSLWIDLAHRVVVALCTNRTLSGRGNVGIRELRPRFHDAVATWLGLAD